MKSALIKHKNIHSGEETFTCGICSYECNTLNQIIHHQNAHYSENAFICTIYDYTDNFFQHPSILSFIFLHFF